MPDNFKSKNGATLAGHSKKWADSKRPQNSMNAGSGSRASRNQGLGAQGRANTMAGEVTDTSTMSPEEKFKYFKALGLIKDEPQAAPIQEPVQEPMHEPEEVPQQDAPRFNIKDLVGELQSTFGESPKYITAITNELKGLDKQMLLYVAEKALDAVRRAKTKSNDPSKIAPYVIREIQRAKN